MPVLTVILWIGGAGLLGGLVNALLSDDGFIIFGIQRLADGRTILRPGFLGNALIGVITAIVLAGLYTPLGAAPMAGTLPYPLTVQTLVGAVVSGVGGARLLNAEVTKRINQDTIGALASTVQRLTEQG
jgi:hypothetical protein